jgi:hypothetical protein
MRYALAALTLLAGCAHDPFKENVQKLIDCEYRYASKPGLTCLQIYDLQMGCYTLYQMRNRSAK